jgi:hypothetical protein
VRGLMPSGPTSTTGDRSVARLDEVVAEAWQQAHGSMRRCRISEGRIGVASQDFHVL